MTDDSNNRNHDSSRRRLIQAAGVAAVAGASGFGQRAAAADAPTAAAVPLADPRGLFPHAPFKAQPQPWPGLASKMDPRPDHGSTATGAADALPDGKP